MKDDSTIRKDIEKRRKVFPSMENVLGSMLGDEYNYQIISCTLDPMGNYDPEHHAKNLKMNYIMRGRELQKWLEYEQVWIGSTVECNVEEKTDEEYEFLRWSDANNDEDEALARSHYKIDSISLEIDGSSDEELEEITPFQGRWTANARFSVNESKLSKFAKEHSGSIAELCADNQDDWEYEGEFIGKGNEISVSIKPDYSIFNDKSAPIASINRIRQELKSLVEGLLYS